MTSRGVHTITFECWIFPLSCFICRTVVFLSWAIFWNICMPCDIKGQLQTMRNNLFWFCSLGDLIFLKQGLASMEESRLFVMELERGLICPGFRLFLTRLEGGHMKQGRRPAKVWISNVCPQFYPDVRCENLILNFGLKSFTLFLGTKYRYVLA